MTEKSFFNNFMNLFSIKHKKSGVQNISAGKAINLQNAYISATQHLTDTETFPYTEIVKQLYSPKEEIFAAALYYLKKIAKNEPDEVPDILSELNVCLSKKKKMSPLNTEQIKQTIADINNFYRI